MYQGRPVHIQSGPECHWTPEAVHECRIEFSLHRHLAHPNIAPCIGGHFNASQPHESFLMYEHAPHTLRSLVHGLHVPLMCMEVCLLARGVCRVGHYFAEQGIAHGGLELDAFVVDSSFAPQIRDLGLRRALRHLACTQTLAHAPDNTPPPKPTPTHPRPRVPIPAPTRARDVPSASSGTAPELLLQNTCTLASDVYSAGILIGQLATGALAGAYELMTPYFPPERTSYIVRCRKHGGEPLCVQAREILAYRRDLLRHVSLRCPPLHAVVASCLDMNPEARPSFQALVSRLESIMGALEPHESVTPSRDCLAGRGTPQQDLDACMRQGAEHIARYEYSRAIPYFAYVVRFVPDHVEAQVQWGACLRQLFRELEAVSHFERAVQLDPANSRAHRLWGCALINLNTHKTEGLAHLRRAYALDPGDRIARGLIFLLTGSPHKAIPLFQQEIAQSPRIFTGYGCLSSAYCSLCQHEQALGPLRKVLDMDPCSSRAHLNLGATYLIWGKSHESIPYYRRAIELDTHNYHARHALGRALINLGRYDEALDHFKQALEVSPKGVYPLGDIFRTWLRNHRTAEAKQYCTEVLRRDPSRIDAKVCLGEVLCEARDVHGLELLRECARERPTDEGIVSLIARWLCVEARFAEAASCFAMALRASPCSLHATSNMYLIRRLIHSTQ